MATIRDIMDAIETVILATPAPAPTGLPYRKASGVRELMREPHGGSDSQREFAVEADTITGVGTFIGPCWQLTHAVVVFIRYAHDENADDYAELQRMAASDAGRIVSAIITPEDATISAAGAEKIEIASHQRLEQLTEPRGVWLQGIAFEITYSDNGWR